MMIFVLRSEHCITMVIEHEHLGVKQRGTLIFSNNVYNTLVHLKQQEVKGET